MPDGFPCSPWPKDKRLRTRAGQTASTLHERAGEGNEHDQMDARLIVAILFWLRPCALRTPGRPFANTSGPSPVRDFSHSDGCPWFTGHPRLRAEAGTILVRRSIEILKRADKLSLCWLLEFPEDLGRRNNGARPASPFQDKDFQDFVNKSGAFTGALFRCQWEDEFARKPTRLVSSMKAIASSQESSGESQTSRSIYAGRPVLDDAGYHLGTLPTE